MKVPFITSRGAREDLAADVLKIQPPSIRIRLLTPPVTQEKPLERDMVYDLADLADWVILMPDGNYKGGFTMKIMFKTARKLWGKLPPQLAEEEKKYVG